MTTSGHVSGALPSTGPCVTPAPCLTLRRLLVSRSQAGAFLLESAPREMVHVSDDGLSHQTQEGEEERHSDDLQGYFHQH